MTDTPQHIQDLQLKIWLSKSPGERLLQAIKNNQEMFLFAKEGKKAMSELQQSKSNASK